MDSRIVELSQEFYFDAAHTLERTIDIESSRRIHGHTYHARVTIRGNKSSETGMLLDLGYFKNILAEVRECLDHRLLDEVPGLGPATLENLCTFIWDFLEIKLPSICKVSVERRASGDACTLYLATTD